MSEKITESDSPYRHLEDMDTHQILSSMNLEDQKVAIAVAEQIPSIEKLVTAVAEKLAAGGRLFYIGAGTSGRLGVLDASECPPTFGVPETMVNGIIAGGTKALTTAVESIEDDPFQGWNDLELENISTDDFVIGLSASGSAAYVVKALEKCKQKNIFTGSISCNPGAAISAIADFPVEVIVGPEFITGSTRLKSGTAQKMVLNMISTTVMIRLGRIEDNKMVDMQLSNEKLVNRGIRFVMDELNISYEKAEKLLMSSGSVRAAIEKYRS